MARQESPRENLLRDARALVRRAELRAPGDVHDPVVFVGFRSGGAASVYFGEDPAYHFTSSGRLRRAYHAGRLIKAERGRLVALVRTRPGGEIQLRRHDLTDEEQRQFLDELAPRLMRLGRLLAAGTYRVAGQVPADADLTGEVQSLLARLTSEGLRVADSPRVA